MPFSADAWTIASSHRTTRELDMGVDRLRGDAMSGKQGEATQVV
jgi:hypothetical protein